MCVFIQTLYLEDHVFIDFSRKLLKNNFFYLSISSRIMMNE